MKGFLALLGAGILGATVGLLAGAALGMGISEVLGETPTPQHVAKIRR